MGRALYQPGDARWHLLAGASPRPFDRTDEQWTVAPDIRLHHFESGQGSDVLVVHGGPGLPLRQPLAGLRPLEDRFLFHYYDQRGCGLSTRPFGRFARASFFANMQKLESTLGLAAQVADIERIRQGLGQDQIVLVGHSWGGFLASLYAAEFPQRVRGLVLVAPAAVLVFPSPDGGLFAEIERRLPAERLSDYRAFLRDSFDFRHLFDKSEADLVALHARLVPFYVEAGLARGFAVPESRSEDGGGFMVEAQYLSMGRRHDYRDALARVSAPTLVLHGDEDLQSMETTAVYSNAIPGARLVRVEAAGHFPFAEQPERFAEVVGAFLDGLPRPARTE
jgi:proline iminopeptidase